jgi:hypothetical protein
MLGVVLLNTECRHAKDHYVNMIGMLSAVMLSGTMLIVIMLSVIMLTVIMLIVVALFSQPKSHSINTDNRKYKF